MRHVVIITYCYHYHICQVAIKKAIERFNPAVITIMVDDHYIQNTRFDWRDIGNLLTKDLRETFGLTTWRQYKMGVLPFSLIPDIHTETSGWIRQQYIKLSLHKLLSNDEWLIIDGDTLINEDLDPYKFFYINANDYDLMPQNYFFTRYVLNLDQEKILFNNKLIELNGPIKVLDRKTLSGMEEYIFDLHGTTVRGIRDSFTFKNKHKYLELSEYDLIAYYQTFVSKDLKPLKHFGFYVRPSADLYSQWDFLKDKVAVLDGKDDLPIAWYEQFGININFDVWERLEYIKK